MTRYIINTLRKPTTQTTKAALEFEVKLVEGLLCVWMPRRLTHLLGKEKLDSRLRGNDDSMILLMMHE